MRRAQLLDGGYVEVIEKDGGWTYVYAPATESSRAQWAGEVPDIYSSPDEAEAVARHRFEAELVTDFADTV